MQEKNKKKHHKKCNRTSLSRDSTGHQSRLVRMLPVEGCNKVRVEGSPSGDSGLPFRIIPLPVDKILQASSSTSGPQEM